MILLYRIEPIGVNGAMEACEAFGFCSDTCRQEYRRYASPETKWREAEEAEEMFDPDHVCDTCGKRLAPLPAKR